MIIEVLTTRVAILTEGIKKVEFEMLVRLSFIFARKVQQSKLN